MGTPSVASQKDLLEVLPAFFRFNVPNLQILQIGDIPSLSTNFIIQFHNHDAMLVPQLWAREISERGGEVENDFVILTRLERLLSSFAPLLGPLATCL